MTLRGIDISGHQAVIHWDQLDPERTAFVVIKATGGGTFHNTLYPAQLAAARANKRIVGHYHYAHELSLDAHNPQGRYSPEQEADNFLNYADVQPGEFVALDIEDPRASGDLSNWATRWLTRIEERLGFLPLIYSYPDYLATRGLNIQALARWPLWYARYYTPYRDNPVPNTPPRWSHITMWQWSGGTPVQGIPIATDENLFFGSEADLLALGRPGLEGQTVTFVHAPGFLQPIVDNFNWGGAGIITKRVIEVFNDEEGKWYRGTWTADSGITWEVIGEVGK